MKFDEVVAGYIKLRDRKAGIKAEYDLKIAKIDEVLDKIEGKLIAHFQETGLESIRTEAGTAYKSTRISAPVADWDALLAHILTTENYQLLERRVSKKAVEEYKAANEDLPPGVSWREEVVVNVRRG
jgi:hypothetical protein